MAKTISALEEEQLNAHVLNALGAPRLAELKSAALAAGANVALYKALALVYADPGNAAAIAKLIE